MTIARAINHPAFMYKQAFLQRNSALLIVILIATATGARTANSAETTTKDAMLHNTAQHVIIPAYQNLAAKSQTLCHTIEKLNHTPTSDSRTNVLQAWLETQIAAREIQWLQTGPIADREFLATFYYGKIIPTQIDAVMSSTRAIDASYLDEISASAKGLSALEYLLYGEQSVATSTNTNAPRRGQLLLAIAEDVHRKAAAISADWAKTNRLDAAPKFSAGGQETLNTLINALTRILENIAEEHLNLALRLPPPITRQLDRIEGARSSTSLPQLSGMLRGDYNTYHGSTEPGLDNYLSGLNPALATRVEHQFQESLSALKAIPSPLQTALVEQTELVKRAYEAVRNLEILYKVDVASALGVTITFSSNDGD